MGELPLSSNGSCSIEAAVNDRQVAGSIAVAATPALGVEQTLAKLERRVTASGGVVGRAGEEAAIARALTTAPMSPPVTTDGASDALRVVAAAVRGLFVGRVVAAAARRTEVKWIPSWLIRETKSNRSPTRCLNMCKADAVEVRFSGGERSATRFANSSITANLIEHDQEVTITVRYGQKSGERDDAPVRR